MSHSLSATAPTLPSAWYLDEAHHRRELDTIWHRDWVYAGRASLWAAPGDYRVLTIGGQRVIVLRDTDGGLRAFLDTCRHRGAALCEHDSGRFASGRIVCPYHAWSYTLDGTLAATPRRVPSADFDPANHPLYAVALHEWGGFVFLNLDPAPRLAFEEAYAAEIAGLASWPLATLRSAHRESHVMDFDWKIFWDNYLECAHCPGVHPELSKLVPVYATGQLRYDDDPACTATLPAEVEARLRAGARSWTPDGQCRLPEFAGIDEAAIAPGMRFATLLPSVFVVAHRDYVRSVSLRPLGAGRTEVSIEWLVDAAVDPATIDLEHLTAFGRMVVLQDARVSALTQRGLQNRRHEAGVLMPQEYDVLAFQRWVAARVRGEHAVAPEWAGDVRVQSAAEAGA